MGSGTEHSPRARHLRKDIRSDECNERFCRNTIFHRIATISGMLYDTTFRFPAFVRKGKRRSQSSWVRSRSGTGEYQASGGISLSLRSRSGGFELAGRFSCTDMEPHDEPSAGVGKSHSLRRRESKVNHGKECLCCRTDFKTDQTGRRDHSLRPVCLAPCGIQTAPHRHSGLVGTLFSLAAVSRSLLSGTNLSLVDARITAAHFFRKEKIKTDSFTAFLPQEAAEQHFDQNHPRSREFPQDARSQLFPTTGKEA